MSNIKRTISILFCVLIGFLLLKLAIYYLSFPLPAIEKIQSYSEILKIFVEIIAIIVAGLWSYRLFIKNRVDFPYAEVNHAITHCNLGNNYVYMSLFVTIKNCGKVLVEIDSGLILVQQILPLLDELKFLIQESNDDDLREGKTKLFHENNSQIAWRELGCRESKWKKGEVEIEPGEIEEFQYDFILKEDIESVRVITYFKNFKFTNPVIGWRKTTIYNLKGASDGQGK